MRAAHPTALLRLITAALPLLALAGPAGAQSLKELYEAARGYDAQYLAARAAAAAAPYAAAQVRSELFPQVNASATLAHTNNRTYDVPVGNETLTVNTSNNSSQIGLDATQWLFNRSVTAKPDGAALLEQTALA